MTTVFCVIEEIRGCESDDHRLVRVFRTEEGANRFVDEHQNGTGAGYGFLEIEEMEVEE